MAFHIQMMETATFYKIDYFQIFIVFVRLGIPFSDIERFYFYTNFSVNFVVCADGIVQNGLWLTKYNSSKCKYYVLNSILVNLTLR